MSWIILALTLGASITSMIHGVFMLFGSLSVSGATLLPGIPSTMLASLPVISAIFALIGGIIAFNQSKWGALFLFIAMGLCAATRDTWLYGGLYFFAGVFCFLLRPKQQNDHDYIYEEGDEEVEYGESDMEGRDFYYEDDPPEQIAVPSGERHSPFRRVRLNPEPDDNEIGLQLNSEPVKVRRRSTKTCPECLANVPSEARICPNCGARLFVIGDNSDTLESLVPVSPADDGSMDMRTVSEHLSVPLGIEEMEEGADNIEPYEEAHEEVDPNIMEDEDEEMSTAQTISPGYRVTKPKRSEQDLSDMQRVNVSSKRGRPKSMSTDAAETYQEFSQSKFAKRAKKRKRSSGRKILSMFLLVMAVGGALYFLLGLRKLPPGDLPPIARTEIVSASSGTLEKDTRTNPSTIDTGLDDGIAEPVDVAVAESALPNFVPDREPKSGTVVGSNVNVRADHTTNSSKVTRLSVGSKVEIIGSFNVPSGKYAGIWYNVSTGGREGWIYGKYVQPVGSGLPSGYSNGLLKSFGGSLTQLVKNFGQPLRKTSSSAEWSGITATLRGEDITKIKLTNPGRELQNGLKTGMSQTALLQIMGYPSSVNSRTMNYNENGRTGVAVQLDRNNSISSITVSEIQ